MPRSAYVESIRARIGHDLLLLPAVTAVIRDGERYLLSRSAGSVTWSLVGGAVEPAEEPADAVAREVLEETGAHITLLGIIGVYGGEPMIAEYPNGDRVGYVTTAYACEVLDAVQPDMDELVELGWFTPEEIAALPRNAWIDRILGDARGIGCDSGGQA